jgi:ubiquinone/menaquinone biosynthesis C-methylase UbiE
MRNPFDDLAAGYEAWYATPLGAFVIAQEETELRRILTQTGGGRVLDVGAGTGRWARRLAQQGRHVTALEPSESMARLGEARSRDFGVR